MTIRQLECLNRVGLDIVEKLPGIALVIVADDIGPEEQCSMHATADEAVAIGLGVALDIARDRIVSCDNPKDGDALAEIVDSARLHLRARGLLDENGKHVMGAT